MQTIESSNPTSLFATSAAGAVWWTVDVLYRLGPSWSVVPPILIGAASLIGAIGGYQNDRQKRRHAEERHRAAMAANEVNPVMKARTPWET
jgi:hypothetical protein